MRRGLWLMVITLASCAPPPIAPALTALPPRPAVLAVNPVGEWTATAIDGVALREGELFSASITPDHFQGAACNTIDGAYRVDGHRFIHTGPWRSTERGCFDPTGRRDVMATETRAFAIMSSPLNVVMPTADTLRFYGEGGSIDLARGSPLSRIIVGEWTAVAFDQRPAAAADRFALTVTPTAIDTTGLCNEVRGAYRLVGRRIEAVDPPWPRTERGCPAVQRLEERARAVLDAAMSPTITMLDPDRMRVTSARGSIDFERRR